MISRIYMYIFVFMEIDGIVATDALVTFYSSSCQWFKSVISLLTHWGRDKMAAIYQTTFSNAFSWRKIYKFRLRFPEICSYGPINDISALVQIMAWRRPGDKPLSEPMVVNLLTHICVTQPQWVNAPEIPQSCSKLLICLSIHQVLFLSYLMICL